MMRISTTITRKNDNYLIDKALGNIKDDPDSVQSRPRRIPIYKIQLSDEDKIPKMPENILQEPKDEEYQKKIDELKKKNNEKRTSIDEYIEKRKQETMGVESDDKENVFQKKKNVGLEIKKLTDEINKEEQAIAPIRKKFNLLNEKVKSYERYHFNTTNVKKIATEIRKIQEKISFSNINVNEEQDLLNRKAALEDYQKDLKAFQDFKKENNETLNKTKDLKAKRKVLFEERDKLDKEIQSLKSKKENKKPEIDRINKIIDSLKEDKKKINEEIRQVYKEWNDKWYEYNEQQKLIQYIKDAQAKIKGLKKREKKAKEGEEKGEKGEKGETKDEDNLKIIQYTPNENEIKLKQYNDLKDYFTALLPREQQEQKAQDIAKSNNDISKDIKAGKLKKMEKQVDNEWGEDSAAGKKVKKAKIQKNQKILEKKQLKKLDLH